MKRLMLLLLFCTCMATKGQLRGRVIEKASGTALPGTILKLASAGTVLVSDAEGAFRFPAGAFSFPDTLTAQLTGYQTYSVIVNAGDSMLRVTLTPALQLKEVEVTYRSNGTELSTLNVMKTETLNERSLMKAACCNLSESFETNPSVDVSFSDAVSGSKQIQLLGLEGKYAQITKENMPYLRGLSNAYGLLFIPGTWIKSIQLGKGAGSVINGYESFTGQINTELQAPENTDKLFFNTYLNENGRNEYNLNLGHKLNDKVATVLMNHLSVNPLAQDMNHDGFVDIPTGQQVNISNKYSVFTGKGFEWQFGGSVLMDEREGGQLKKHHPDNFPLYRVSLRNNKWDVFSKSGYVIKRRPATSMGLQLSYTWHDQDNVFGLQTFSGQQKTVYANYIFESYLFTTNHKYKVGASYLNDNIQESYRLFRFNRNETATGVFGEYTFTWSTKLNLVVGWRADYHNYYGWFATPRLHLRYAPRENTIFRISAGRALRTANALMENTSVMVSSRQWLLEGSNWSLPYGLNPEVAWNYGGNFTQKFSINYREAYITLDVYRTDFQQQLVVDLEDPRSIRLYNLNGRSWSNNIQLEFNCEPRKRLFLKTAYRFVDAQMDYKQGLLEKPFTARQRGFINLMYETRNEQWQLDATVQYNGSKRLPNTSGNPDAYRLPERSPSFYNVLGQITYLAPLPRIKLHVYLGVENALNFKQTNPVLSSGSPFGSYFDGGMAWGPVYGRMLYAGLRLRIK
ncbi:MAG: TonB-dependent receptor [Sediminibacterium sp.]|nr:TonB-dependent receptor [Sediminibacterium sp.]